MACSPLLTHSSRARARSRLKMLRFPSFSSCRMSHTLTEASPGESRDVAGEVGLGGRMRRGNSSSL